MDPKSLTTQSAPYEFQIESFNKFKKNDIIVNIPTGKGKTLIACMAISSSLISQGEKTDPNQYKKIIFIAPKAVIVDQQAKVIEEKCKSIILDNLKCELKVMSLYGSKIGTGKETLNDRIWNQDIAPDFLPAHVIVATPEIIRQLIEKKYLYVNDCCLFIFDECHNATGKSPMAVVCNYIDEGKRENIRVLGLTASFENSSFKSDAKLIKTKRVLENLMGCEVFVPKSLNQKAADSNEGNDDGGGSGGGKTSGSGNTESGSGEVETIAYNTIRETAQVNLVQSFANNFFEDLREQFPTCEMTTSSKINTKYLADVENVFENLGFFGVIIYLRDVLLLEFQEKDYEFKRMFKISGYEFPYEDLYETFKYNERKIVDHDDGTNIYEGMVIRADKYIKLFLLLQNDSKCKMKKGIIFTQRIISAIVLRGMLQSDFKKIRSKPDEILIALGGKGMAQNKCFGNLESFRNSRSAVLVSTEVTQEGIDVSNCSFVVSYDFVPNTKAFIQAKGRAREAGSTVFLFENTARDEVDKEKQLAKAASNNLSTPTKEEKDQASQEKKDRRELYKHIHPFRHDGAMIHIMSSIRIVHEFMNKIFGSVDKRSLLEYTDTSPKQIRFIRVPNHFYRKEEVYDDEGNVGSRGGGGGGGGGGEYNGDQDDREMRRRLNRKARDKGWIEINVDEVNDWFSLGGDGDNIMGEVIPLNNIIGSEAMKDDKNGEEMKFYYLAAIELCRLGYLNDRNECCKINALPYRNLLLDICELPNRINEQGLGKRKVVDYSKEITLAPLHFKFYWANPFLSLDNKGYVELGLEMEEDKIKKDAFKELTEKNIIYTPALATRESLSELADKPCTILHISCHGEDEIHEESESDDDEQEDDDDDDDEEEDVEFVLNDKNDTRIHLALDYSMKDIDLGGKVILGGTDAFTPRDIIETFEHSPYFNPILVCLFACHSEMCGKAFIALGVRHVIAVNRKYGIKDVACRIFSGYFNYYLLVRRFTISDAFSRAKRDTEKYSKKEAAKFMLLPKKTHAGDLRHDVKINIPDKYLEDQSKQPPKGNLFQHTSSFVGRHKELQEAYEYLHDAQSVLAITGEEKKIGKTEVAVRLLNHSYQKHEFDYYWVIDCSQLQTPLQLAQKLYQLVEMDDDDRKESRGAEENTMNDNEDYIYLKSKFEQRFSNQNIVLLLARINLSSEGYCEIISSISKRKIKIVVTCPNHKLKDVKEVSVESWKGKDEPKKLFHEYRTRSPIHKHKFTKLWNCEGNPEEIIRYAQTGETKEERIVRENEEKEELKKKRDERKDEDKKQTQEKGAQSAREVKSLVTENGLELEFVAPEFKKDRNVVLAAINNNGMALEFASDELKVDPYMLGAAMKKDPNCIIFALRCNGILLKHATKEQRNDFIIVMEAVMQNGLALRFSSESMKSNEVIVVAAMNQNGLALEHAPTMRNNEMVVNAALNQNPESCKFLSKKQLKALNLQTP